MIPEVYQTSWCHACENWIHAGPPYRLQVVGGRYRAVKVDPCCWQVKRALVDLSVEKVEE